MAQDTNFTLKSQLLCPQQMAVIKKQLAQIQRQALSLPFRGLAVLLGLLGIGGAVGVEMGFLFYIFSSFKGAALPGESNLDLYLTACGAFMMIMGYHFAVQKFGEHGLIRWLNNAAKWLIPLYFFGIAALLMFINTSDIVALIKEMLAEHSSTGAGWGNSAASTIGDAMPWPIEFFMGNVLPYIAFLFGPFSIGLALVALFIANILIEMVISQIRQITDIRQRSTMFLRHHSKFKTTLSKLRKVTKRHEKLSNTSSDALLSKAMTAVMKDIQLGIRACNYWLAQRRGQSGFNAAQFFRMKPEFGAPPEEITTEQLEELRDQLKSITPANIRKIITKNFNEGE